MNDELTSVEPSHPTAEPATPLAYEARFDLPAPAPVQWRALAFTLDGLLAYLSLLIVCLPLDHFSSLNNEQIAMVGTAVFLLFALINEFAFRSVGRRVTGLTLLTRQNIPPRFLPRVVWGILASLALPMGAVLITNVIQLARLPALGRPPAALYTVIGLVTLVALFVYAIPFTDAVLILVKRRRLCDLLTGIFVVRTPSSPTP